MSKNASEQIDHHIENHLEGGMTDGKAIIYRVGDDPAWLELGSTRESADAEIVALLTKDWGAMPLFKWLKEPGGDAHGYIGWYLLYNPDAVVDAAPNETAINLYQGAWTTGARPRVLSGTVVLVSTARPWTSPATNHTVEYCDISTGARFGDKRYVRANLDLWPKGRD